MMTPQTKQTNDEAQIRHLIAKDYIDGIKALPCAPCSIRTETRDLNVHVSGDVALAHWRFRLVGPENSHPAMRTWMRNTVAYRRSEGQWEAVPGHWSAAFAPIALT